ncbi:hypothetical protein LR48_Vigan617s000600 [Vigna angularis]|uniref:Uncharacterized protein n=1 Tax=Phaseolus angularis TaxID=3914 RepID=A0A0L9TEF2_PHAAN|nr:hypothetical protein LR48_Vigan617s000600 [Vigna angularis]
MASSSLSRRKGKVVRIARNANPIRTISDEDIRGKLLSLRKIKTVGAQASLRKDGAQRPKKGAQRPKKGAQA